MKYPEFLKKNGTIGFVAPAFGCNIEPYKTAFRHSLQTWKKLGCRTQCGPNVYAGDGIGISSTPEKCGRELMDMYLSEDNDILISCGGGELMCEDLEYIDFERLKAARPKWFMGYSDNTNFTFLLTTLCDTASIYGPCAPAFGMEPWHPALQDALGVLTGDTKDAAQGKAAAAPEEADVQEGSMMAEMRIPPAQRNVLTVNGYDKYETEGKKDEEHPLEPYNVTEPCVRRCFLPSVTDGKTGMEEVALNDSSIVFSGRLIGGCLDILVMLLGTKYDKVRAFNERYKDDGIIWFIEACDLNVMSIRRAVWQMKNAGWFQHVKGILAGRPLNGEAFLGMDRYRAVTDLLSDLEVPVLMDLDIGHIPPMMPLVLGSYATVSMAGNDVKVEMELRP